MQIQRRVTAADENENATPTFETIKRAFGRDAPLEKELHIVWKEEENDAPQPQVQTKIPPQHDSFRCSRFTSDRETQHSAAWPRTNQTFSSGWKTRA